MILFKAYFKVPKHGILKNSKQLLFNKGTGKHFISKSDDAVICEQWMLARLRIEKIKQRLDTISTDINAKYVFHFPKTVYYTKKGERSLRIPDLDNLLSMPNDCLQKAEVISNDTIICSFDGSHRAEIEGTEYYLEIELTTLARII